MGCSAVMFSLFLLSPCESAGGTEVSEAVAAAVSNPQRPAEDVAKDANRQPGQVVSFIDIKPGAVLGLIDHVADSGGETAEVAKKLHRIDPQVVRDDFANSCFTLEAEAEFLRNSKDDHTLAVFDPSVRGETDRFVFRFVRN